MIHALRRQFQIYAAFAALVPKLYMAYSIWFWMEYLFQIISMTIFVYFWRAVYANSTSIQGLTLEQMITYILLAQIFLPVITNRMILDFGSLVSQGLIGTELLRPVDFQLRYYVDGLASLGLFLLLKIPLVLLGWFVFGMQLPGDPAIWAVFILSLILGHAVMFVFDYSFACLAFYTTETWGMSVVREGLAIFFSGALVPLALMPDWLQQVAAWMPFAQALAVPISFLSGVTPLSQMLPVLGLQFAWLVGLGLFSRLVFSISVRKVTVQGG